MEQAMSQTVKVKMDEVANSIAMVAEYKAHAELRITTLATQLDKYEKQLLDVQSQLIDRNTELFNERECTHTLTARVKALESGLEKSVKALANAALCGSEQG